MIGECSWFPSGKPPTHQDITRFQKQLMEYEERSTKEIHAKLPLTGVCFFDKTVFPASVILGIEHVHPNVVTSQ